MKINKSLFYHLLPISHYLLSLRLLTFTYWVLALINSYADNYKLRFTKMVRITKKNKEIKEIIYIKNKFRFFTGPVNVYGKEIVLTTKHNQTFIKNKNSIFFKFPFINGKCNGLKGTLRPIKITFLHCKLITKLRNNVKIYAYPDKIRYRSPYNALILYNSYITTCSLPKPHYKVKVGKSYITLSHHKKKYSIDKIYLKNIDNILLIPFTGFRRSFFIVQNGQQKKVTFRGLNFFSRSRFKKTLTLYFTNVLYPSKNSSLDFNFYPSYSTKRGFFIEYNHIFKAPLLQEKTEFFHLNDRIKKPSNSFETFFFPPPTRNRFFYHTYGDIYTKYFQTKYEIYKLSDANLLQELFPYKFKDEKQPETYLNLQKFIMNNLYVRVFTRPNINNFIEQTEYLPLLKLGILNFNLSEKLSITFLSSIAYLEKTNQLLAVKENTVRLTAKNMLVYKLYQEYLNVNLYTGWAGNYYSNKESTNINDKTLIFAGLGITKPLFYATTNYSYLGLFEIKYIQTKDLTNKPNTALFFDKEDILSEAAELYYSVRNNLIFTDFEIEYNIYMESYTKKLNVKNQTSFFPFELPDNPNPINTNQLSYVQDLKFKIKEFTLATRYENNVGKLFTKKPYLFSLSGEYKYKNKFIVRSTYNVSQDVANSIGIYTGLQLSSKYYAEMFINYYLNEHRIINNILTLTRVFHDFYFNIGFSRDTIRNEIRFSISLEPKFGEKNILEENAKTYHFRRE